MMEPYRQTLRAVPVARPSPAIICTPSSSALRDVRWALEQVARRYDERLPICLVGRSLGGELPCWQLATLGAQYCGTRTTGV